MATTGCAWCCDAVDFHRRTDSGGATSHCAARERTLSLNSHLDRTKKGKPWQAFRGTKSTGRDAGGATKLQNTHDERQA